MLFLSSYKYSMVKYHVINVVADTPPGNLVFCKL